ncbi:hypothetical protein [Cochlodiniinecator piscidefendens]|uniref:hypothetical protein n=1 Tax=Cochlodiniinecator piscidefendens TaxID=2715756 RepID=UPI00197C2B51|nr:hypothetical protein [Cochlodiniinecator piscidefendens]
MASEVVAGVMGTRGRPVQLSERQMMRRMRQWGGKKISASAFERDEIECAFFRWR